MQKKILKLLSELCFLITVFSVNSCCLSVYGQNEEPETLKKLKRHTM